MLLQKNALIRIDRSSFNSYILTPKYIHFLKRWNPKTTLTICQVKREGDGEETYGCPNIYIYIYIYKLNTLHQQSNKQAVAFWH